MALLQAHAPQDDTEASHLERMKAFALTLEKPFSRHQEGAHFTGSALVVDVEGERLVLVQHAKLKRWLQPGGHADALDGGFLQRTALREAAEETGCRVTLHPLFPHSLDVDVHLIPARVNEAEHFHLDVRFLVMAENPEALRFDSRESLGARWVSFDEALELADDESLLRLIRKGRQVFKKTP